MMMDTEVQVDLLVGRLVRDEQGRRVGRIEEMRVVCSGNQWIVTHFLLGSAGLMERLSMGGIRRWLLSLTGGRRPRLHRVLRMALDLSDPLRPRLRDHRGGP